MIRYLRFPTPFGPMIAAAEADALVAIHFEGARHAPPIAPDWREDPADALLARCARELGEYFRGERMRFDLPLAVRGTPFQRSVWREIARIAHGRTLTYSELAQRAGAPGCARAAGTATGRNPFTIVVPCHRVLGSNGALTGYAGGLERKARLLALEAARVRAAA